MFDDCLVSLEAVLELEMLSELDARRLPAAPSPSSRILSFLAGVQQDWMPTLERGEIWSSFSWILSSQAVVRKMC